MTGAEKDKLEKDPMAWAQNRFRNLFGNAKGVPPERLGENLQLCGQDLQLDPCSATVLIALFAAMRQRYLNDRGRFLVHPDDQPVKGQRTENWSVDIPGVPGGE